MGVFAISTALLDNYEIQHLNGSEYKRKMLAAVSGEENEFSKFIRFDGYRIFDEEWKFKREFVFFRDDFTCRYCGQRGGRLECDHVVPVCMGGSDSISNLVTACRKCNRSKSGKALDEWYVTANEKIGDKPHKTTKA